MVGGEGADGVVLCLDLAFAVDGVGRLPVYHVGLWVKDTTIRAGAFNQSIPFIRAGVGPGGGGDEGAGDGGTGVDEVELEGPEEGGGGDELRVALGVAVVCVSIFAPVRLAEHLD